MLGHPSPTSTMSAATIFLAGRRTLMMMERIPLAMSGSARLLVTTSAVVAPTASGMLSSPFLSFRKTVESKSDVLKSLETSHQRVLIRGNT